MHKFNILGGKVHCNDKPVSSNIVCRNVTLWHYLVREVVNLVSVFLEKNWKTMVFFLRIFHLYRHAVQNHYWLLKSQIQRRCSSQVKMPAAVKHLENLLLLQGVKEVFSKPCSFIFLTAAQTDWVGLSSWIRWLIHLFSLCSIKLRYSGKC